MVKRHFILILTVLVVFGLLGFPPFSRAKEGEWTQKADMPAARNWIGTTAVNGIIYAIGGWAPGDLNVVEAYDPATDTWTKKADMPTARVSPSTIAVNGKIYAIGGVTHPEWLQGSILPEFFISTVEEYDPATDTWAKRADMPTTKWGFSIGVVNGKIYVIGGHFFGGYSYSEETQVLATVEEYDPVTDTWTKKADMPTPRTTAANNAPTVNGKIYFIGGSSIGYPNPENGLSTVEEYNPATDTWAKKTDMPTARSMMAISEVNGKIYVIGGGPYRGSPLRTIEEYDPATDTWAKKADMPTARYMFSASAVNGHIYAIGGNNNANFLKTVEEYDTGTGIPWIRVTLVSLQEGSAAGGEPIAIQGNNFPPDVIVTIGGKPLAQMKITARLITGFTPPGIEGEQGIWLTPPGLDYPIFAGKFVYGNLPPSNIMITRVVPTNGKQAGGDAGSIIGSGFAQGAVVTIGGISAADVKVTSTLITFTFPSGSAGAKDVVVTNPDGQKVTLRNGYTYNPLPVIKSAEPKGGPLEGNTTITITGSSFMQGLEVYIGDRRVSQLEFTSPTGIRIINSSGTSYGTQTIRVINPDGQEAVLENAFSYNPAPYIYKVEPNEGPPEGETHITITGANFIPDIIVSIGGQQADSFYRSSTEITAITPKSDVGTCSIRVMNGDGQYCYFISGFTYNTTPMIKSISPDNGRLEGGTKVTIVGSGFLPNAEVLVSVDDANNMPAHPVYLMASSVAVISDLVITAAMPTGKAGFKKVVVVNRDGQKTLIDIVYRYNALPTISSINPNHGPKSGGTKIIIRGTGFLIGAKVFVGGRQATAVVNDDVTIEAVTPSNPRGFLDIRVVNPDTQYVVKTKAFNSIGELAYNYPNPFRASKGTTFRYVTTQSVQTITVRIFNLAGVPIDVVQGTNSNEVKWHNERVHVGLYVYVMDVKLGSGETNRFKGTLEVYQ